MDDLTFERTILAPIAASMTYPHTPDLRTRVVSRIAAGAPARHRGPMPRLTFAAIAAAIVAAAALTLSIPSSRSAVADFFGIEGSRVEPLPTAPPGTTPTPLPAAQEIDTIATPVPVDAIASAAGYQPALPEGRTPHIAYVVHYGAEIGVILGYDDYTLWQMRSDGEFEGGFEKGVPSTASMQDVLVVGRPAHWISGGPHLVFFYDVRREFVEGSSRTVARNTLIWRTDAALYRLETALPLDEALRVAESLP